jgi:hypothetical protein
MSEVLPRLRRKHNKDYMLELRIRRLEEHIKILLVARAEDSKDIDNLKKKVKKLFVFQENNEGVK